MFKDWEYHFVTNNCQHFADILIDFATYEPPKPKMPTGGLFGRRINLYE